MEHDMLRRFGCALCALVFALTALPTAAFAQQPEEQAAVQQSLSATDVREMQQADAAVTALTGGSDYAQMTEDERTDAALQQLDALTAQGLVKQGSVYTDAENGMISFTYSCGALGGILLTDPEEENTAALPELDESQLQELAENKRVGTAAIYYAFDNTINSTRYPYYAYMQTYWDSVGLQTDLDTTVTVSDLRRMGRYDLCILSTHGTYYTYEYGWLFKKTATEPLILLTERSDFWSDLRYGFDLLAHRVVKVNGMYAVNGDFFRSAYRGNGIVLSETCEFYGKNGHVDTSMADGLLAGGAKAVMGYVNNVYSVYSRSMLWAAVNRMIEGETLEQAVDYAKSIYGTDDIIWYNEQGGRRPHAAASYAMLSGDRSAALPNPYTAADVDAAA
ncbi:hypothetical protein [Faecalibacterium sp. AM43-5AT]|uniref:hypothetical protein n=1 Tax=Faecalibacterium sp. AM43-5AT TaxID=2302957 RepID=UPI000E70EF9A|nr:hypothetical protein [Faecalibacterium sp. AM43-5AT]RJV95006.1 hypothetical protein DW937_10820 [Faecalibacterium sp. AM43-5AT]